MSEASDLAPWPLSDISTSFDIISKTLSTGGVPGMKSVSLQGIFLPVLRHGNYGIIEKQHLIYTDSPKSGWTIMSLF